MNKNINNWTQLTYKEKIEHYSSIMQTTLKAGENLNLWYIHKTFIREVIKKLAKPHPLNLLEVRKEQNKSIWRNIKDYWKMFFTQLNVFSIEKENKNQILIFKNTLILRKIDHVLGEELKVARNWGYLFDIQKPHFDPKEKNLVLRGKV